MTVVLAARPGDGLDRLLTRAETLDQRLWHLPGSIEQAEDARRRLHAAGVSVSSIGATKDDLARALHVGAALRVRTVVVDGGALEGADPEVAADGLVRALHGPLASGAPLAIRNGLGEDALLGYVATEWLLSELPRLSLWFDPSAAMARQRAGVGTDLPGWMDAYGTRMGGLFVHGLGSDGRGGAHPTDDGPDWPALWGALPKAAPRVLALDPAHDDDQVRDAMRYVRGL